MYNIYCNMRRLYKYIIIIMTHAPGPALVSFEIAQRALERAIWRILRLRIEGPCTESYC